MTPLGCLPSGPASWYDTRRVRLSATRSGTGTAADAASTSPTTATSALSSNRTRSTWSLLLLPSPDLSFFLSPASSSGGGGGEASGRYSRTGASHSGFSPPARSVGVFTRWGRRLPWAFLADDEITKMDA
uniref:Uncharacterized protein n=1 Tax=Arundo donax TaxID=35708 RepID=A0A0A9F1S2_ARUDO